MKRPNFLIILSDEHGAQFSGTYGHPLIRTPSMDLLAERGVTFDAAYCNSPLCIPSRLSFMTGRYVSRIAGWDNGSAMPLDMMTWPYLLRSQGYDAVLSGKMHLIGPDKLHGFSRQLAVDLHSHNQIAIPYYPDGITPAKTPWGGVMDARAGTTKEIQADDQSEQAAIAYLRDPARSEQPFALCVGFIAPHFPFVVPEPYFSRYYPDHVDSPDLPEGHLEGLPEAARRLVDFCGYRSYTDDDVRKARAAYYGLVSYLDDKIGRLMATLEEQGLAENTVVIHTSDHGEMLGEHGLWRKMCFYEQAARVPLQVAWPEEFRAGKRVTEAVSLVDVIATVLDLGGLGREDKGDGDTLVPLLKDEKSTWKDEAFCEHMAHGTESIRGMIRQGQWKLCYTYAEPPELELYNLDEDPGEFVNLAGQPAHAALESRLVDRVLSEWDHAPASLNRRVVESQGQRNLIRSLNREKPIF